MRSARGLVVRLAVAGTVAVALLAGGIVSRGTAFSTTRVLNRSDSRFDVLVQRRTESFGKAGGRLGPPSGSAHLTAAEAFSIARGKRQPHGHKPSVRLATFTDPDFPEPDLADPNHRLHPVAVRALVWLVVVPDVPVVDFGPNPPYPSRACPTYTPVDAATGKPFGVWHHC
jgi:hypothetical protein